MSIAVTKVHSNYTGSMKETNGTANESNIQKNNEKFKQNRARMK